jgi:hypothetical protein
MKISSNPLIPDQISKKRKLLPMSICFMAENDFATNGNDGIAMIQSYVGVYGTEWPGYHDARL